MGPQCLPPGRSDISALTTAACHVTSFSHTAVQSVIEIGHTVAEIARDFSRFSSKMQKFSV